MAKKKKQGDENPLEMNLTPMIDCTFQLIIFFIVVGKLSNEDLAPLIVPDPYESLAQEPKEQTREQHVVIVNVYSKFGKDEKDRPKGTLATTQVKGYSIGPTHIKVGQESKITDMLKKEISVYVARGGSKKNVYVEVRSDRDIGYRYVFPVMEAAGRAGIAEMYMTAFTAD